MNKISTLLLVASFLVSQTLQAQLLAGQDNINYEIRMDYLDYTADTGEGGEEEPAWRFKWQFNSDFTDVCDYNQFTIYDECFSYQTDGTLFYQYYKFPTRLDKPTGDYMGFKILNWERDVVSSCDYNSGDDLGNCISFESYGRYGKGAQWNNQIWGYSGRWSMRYSTVWRYVKGNTASNPLNFGTISSGYKNHFNANRSAPADANPQTGYFTTDAGINDSPDVSYSFTISQAKRVELHTVSSYTNFDTYLRVGQYENNVFTEIDANDDSAIHAGTEHSRQSYLSTELCPGTYTVVVEGYLGSVGDFSLLIAVHEPFIAGNSITTSVAGHCAGATLPSINNNIAATFRGTESAVTYAWEKTTDNGTNWQPVSGTSNNLSNPGTMPNSTVSYRRKASATCYPLLSKYSNWVTFTVVEPTHNGGTFGFFGSPEIPPGVDPGYTATTGDQAASAAPGPSNTIWQQKVGNQMWETIPNEIFQSYDIPVLYETTSFRRIIQSACGENVESGNVPAAISNVITITVYPTDGKIAGYVRVNPADPNSGVEDINITMEQIGDLPGSPAGKLYTTMTASDGTYSIDNLYYGSNGGIFKVTPSALEHVFDPPFYENITLNDADHNETRNFTDNSSFVISGNISQSLDETICNMGGIQVDLLLNGVPIGSPVFTDGQGNYQISAIPDNYTVRPTSTKYTFSPVAQPVAVTASIPNVDFTETTKYGLSGYVLAGCNTFMGTATVRITDGCITQNIVTDNTGFYEIANLPAREYTVAVVGYTPIAGFDKLTVLGFFNLGRTLDLTEEDKISNFTFHRPPDIIVTGMPVPLCNGFDKSVIEQLGIYELTISVVEAGTTCPVMHGTVTVNDQISDKGDLPATLNFTQSIFNYTIQAGNPNIIYPYLKNLTISVTDTFDQVVNLNLDALVTGARPRQQNFNTQSPEVPLLILRDPPGDASYSSWETEKTTETATRFYTQDGETNSNWKTTRLGIELSVGAGGIVSISRNDAVWSDTGGSHETIATNTDSEEMILSMTSNQSFQTPAGPEFTGAEGDLFVATALAFSYAIADEILFDENECEPFPSKSLVLAKKGLETTVIYTEKSIKESIIPDLELLRNLSADPGEIDNYNNQIETWNQMIQLNEDLKTASVYDRNISFFGGPTKDEFVTSTSTKSATVEFAMEINKAVIKEMGFNAAGTGISGGSLVNFKMESGKSKTTTTTNSVTTGFHLEDGDGGDRFDFELRTDPVYKTPVFKLLGGKSSCPVAPGTNARDAVKLRVGNPVVAGVAPNGSAAFSFYAGNISESNETRSNYFLKVKDGSNSGGALVKVSGSPFTTPVPVGDVIFEGENEFTVTVERGTSPNYFFEGIEFELYSDCEPDCDSDCNSAVVSTVAVSAFFQSPCSEITLTQPEDSWTVRKSDNNQLVLRMKDYDVNDLDQITAQYAPVGTSNWSDGLVLEANELVNAPTGTEVVWNVANLPEGALNIRLRLSCGTNTIYATRVSGIMDRQAPEIFGLTQPADDNFQTGDEVSITFAETLDCTGLSTADVQLKRIYINETIAATLTCFNNKIVVNPSIDLATLLGEPLEVTLFNVKDLYGNTRINPPTWEFVAGGNINSFDLDSDAVVNARDKCPGFDDNIDTDGDGMPDGCDACADNPNVGLAFDGTDDYVDLGNTAGNFSTTDFTMEIWVKTSGAYEAILGKGTFCTTDQNFWNLGITEGSLWWLSQNVGENYAYEEFHGTTPINDNRWHHVAMVRNDNTLSAYIDGFLEFSNPISSDIDLTNTNSLRIGEDEDDCVFSSWSGQMDELRFWSVARSAADLNDSKNKELPTNEANLLAYYNFNEGIPAANNQSLTTITDLSGNGNTGTLTNFMRTGLVSNWSIGSPIQPLDANKNGVGDACESDALPLRYITLAGNVAESVNQLTWSVVAANQTDTYRIERKGRGGEFTEVGNIPATNKELYTWSDDQPLVAAYYRIVALDEAGKTTRSNIILLQQTVEKVFELINIFPNPTSEIVNIEFTSPRAQSVQVAVLDALGRLVKQQQVTALAGQNRVQLEVRSFAAGIYFIKMLDGTGAVEVKQLAVE